MKWDTGLIANAGPGRMAGMVITAANPSWNYANVLLETYTRTGDSGPMTVYAQNLFTVTDGSVETYAFAGFDLVGIRAVAAGPGSNGVALSVRAFNAEGGAAGQLLVFAEPTYHSARHGRNRQSRRAFHGYPRYFLSRFRRG
ncbi:hypothetical protein SAMN05216312_12128 [Cohnella sp. OV330]|uniref:hypothetical protein n=1 Tax=Cohnella sp. OV330 TaxID=1855288 RepID=UPI0008EB31CC|nr:hypothetical protein [Cohnella sp. OV330]SFB62436.1 hypothetical protein SAMN05216312_12128 [Cohnella sp. OV330]